MGAVERTGEVLRCGPSLRSSWVDADLQDVHFIR